MKTSDFNYELPPERIAQRPPADRGAGRLLVLHRATGEIEHRRFADLAGYLSPGDVVVANNSRVIPARLYGRKQPGGGKVEFLLLERLGARRWRALAGGRRLVEGVEVQLENREGGVSGVIATITAVLQGPQRELRFNQPLADVLDQLGHTPLPPYIHEPLDQPERYQTIYARPPGSAAAPTAGLHFTPDLLLSLRDQGVIFETVTLHVGLDTFKPVAVADIREHTIHSEWARLMPEAAERINRAKLAGGRLIAVGTTTMRTLETAALRAAGHSGSLQAISAADGRWAVEVEKTTVDPSEPTPDAACPWQAVAAFEGATDLYIYPGYRFRAVDALITNFHIPQSSLMMLVSAFAGRDLIMAAYQAATQAEYRFLSFGDAMLIL
jgi:S-adenosylmethionine:tRNA ribosyltransferase-isomerase